VEAEDPEVEGVSVLAVGHLCHIRELPRATSSRAIPGVSLQKCGAAPYSMSAGTPIPTHCQALPHFSPFVRSRVSTGSHCELVARGNSGMWQRVSRTPSWIDFPSRQRLGAPVPQTRIATTTRLPRWGSGLEVAPDPRSSGRIERGRPRRARVHSKHVAGICCSVPWRSERARWPALVFCPLTPSRRVRLFASPALLAADARREATSVAHQGSS
jgi:hypothetical protein